MLLKSVEVNRIGSFFQLLTHIFKTLPLLHNFTQIQELHIQYRELCVVFCKKCFMKLKTESKADN